MFGGECKYNPVRDIATVDQFGFVDLALANLQGSIPSTLSADTTQYNEIEDPNSIVGRPQDEFEMMQLGRALLDRVPKKTEE